MKRGSTNRKANEQAREVLANILLFDVSDPVLNGVTVTSCDVSPDRGFCDVYYSCPVDLYDDAQRAFSHAQGFIRHTLAKKLGWRIVPELRFRLDSTIDDALKIAQALNNDPIKDRI